jgi:hypothetical protein
VWLTNSIVSGNRQPKVLPQDPDVPDNLFGSFNLAASPDGVDSVFNIIGSGNTINDHISHGNGTLSNQNIFTDAPQVSDLGFHGGLTRIHVPLSGSPAIDSGSDSLAVEPFSSPAVALTADQRGNPYARKVDIPNVTVVGAGIVDIGAVELSLAPRIVDVIVKRIVDDLPVWAGEHSFADKIALGQQYRPIATQGANTIEIHFDSPVTLTADALTLVKTTRHPTNINGVPTNTFIPGDGVDFSYNASTFVATWAFPDLGSYKLEDGKYAIFLDSSAVTGVSGQHLDGEWDNGLNASDMRIVTPDNRFDDVGRVFLSGNGTEGSYGGAFRLNFALLTADYAGNGFVDGGDWLLWQQLLGPAWSLADGNGDGLTDAADGSDGNNTGLWNTHFGNFLALQATHGGDLNDDDVVDEQDLAIWRVAYANNAAADINGDGVTNGDDFLLWQQLLSVDNKSAWSRIIDLPAVMEALQIEPPLPAVGDFAPVITNVIVSGSQSTHAPHSFDSVDGSGAQIAAVPVGGADTITIVFSEAVNVVPQSLYVFGIKTRRVPALAEFSYDAVAHAGTWRFENWWYGDQYMLTLRDDVTDGTGNRLDGEWVNPFAVTTTNAAVSEFPTGDGEAGGGFAFVMTLLNGDANQTNWVNSADLAIVLAHLGMTIGATFSQGDFDGDSADQAFVTLFWNGSLESVNWIRADLNSDGRVDHLDTNIIASNAGMTGATWYDGDLTNDGLVTQADLDVAFAQSGPWWDWYEKVA